MLDVDILTRAANKLCLKHQMGLYNYISDLNYIFLSIMCFLIYYNKKETSFLR